MLLLMSLLLGLAPNLVPIDKPPQVLSFDAAEFREAFNAAREQPRLVIVISPSCGHCLRLAYEVNQLVSKHPDSTIKVFVLWAPFMATDNQLGAQRATAYINDAHVVHFWDLWRFVSRAYTKQLKVPELDAWDMLAFYEPHLQWKDEPPTPTFWMQDRMLKIGTPFSPEALESSLEPWWNK